MSARDELFRRVAGAFIDEVKANALLDAYRAEVQADLADWLVKKAHEYHSLRGKENAARVEVLCRMADKIRRGAVRPAVTATNPDPIAYGPSGYRCGCGKDAHSNLVPCTPDQNNVDAEQAAQCSVDAQFPIIAAFLADEGGAR